MGSGMVSEELPGWDIKVRSCISWKKQVGGTCTDQQNHLGLALHAAAVHENSRPFQVAPQASMSSRHHSGDLILP